jgi:hypothetical protein
LARFLGAAAFLALVGFASAGAAGDSVAASGAASASGTGESATSAAINAPRLG